jgi:hypothetical protein
MKKDIWKCRRRKEVGIAIVISGQSRFLRKNNDKFIEGHHLLINGTNTKKFNYSKPVCAKCQCLQFH